MGRRHALSAAKTDRPSGWAYIAAFTGWCAGNGFADLPANWCMDLLWCAEHEAEVRTAHAAQAVTRSRAPPSINPRTLRHGAMKIRQEGAPRKRTAPTVTAKPIATLCAGLVGRLAIRDPACALAEIAELATALEAAALRAQAEQRRFDHDRHNPR